LHPDFHVVVMAENIRHENAGSTSSQPAEPGVAESEKSVPRVIRFGYRNFRRVAANGSQNALDVRTRYETQSV
jgi:hypothetical protein